MSNRTADSIFGFLLGLGFPVAAFILDASLRGLPFGFGAFVQAHRDFPIYWVVDMTPLVLMIVFGLVGARDDRIERQAVELQSRVDAATGIVAADKKFFETLVDSNPLATVVLDIGGKIIKVNPGFEDLFQFRSEEVIGKELDPLITGEEDRQAAVRMTERVLAGEIVRNSFVRLRKDGSRVHVNLHAVPVVVGENRAGALAIYEDVTERMHIQNQLINLLKETDRLASTDSLTGLYNRRAISGLAEAEILRAQRDGLPICLMVIDIDTFKRVNDSFGHQAGDQALCLVAKKLEADKRDDDIVGRWGGDEFIVVLPDTSPADGQKVARRFCELIGRTPLTLADGHEVQLYLSVGICAWESRYGLEIDGEVLFHQADKALLSAKDQGRNRVVYLPVE